MNQPLGQKCTLTLNHEIIIHTVER